MNTWFVYALLSAITGCMVTIFGKLASERVDTILITTIRAILMSVILILLTLWLKRINLAHVWAVEAKDWLYILLAAAASSLTWLFYFAAFKHGDVSKIVSVDRISFIFIILLSALLFNEPLTGKMMLGATFMVFGIFLIAL